MIPMIDEYDPALSGSDGMLSWNVVVSPFLISNALFWKLDEKPVTQVLSMLHTGIPNASLCGTCSIRNVHLK